MELSVLKLGRLWAKSELVTLSLGHVGLEVFVGSIQQVVGQVGMVCRQDIRVRNVLWRVASIEMIGKTSGMGMIIKGECIV